MSDANRAMGQPAEMIQQAYRFVANGELELAEQSYQQLKQRYSSHADVQHLHALICLQSGHFRQGLQDIQRAIKQQPENPVYLQTLARMQYGLGRAKAAEETLLRLVKLHPEFMPAHNQLGVWCAEQQRYQDAEHHYRNAIACQPDEAHNYINLGAVLHYQGRLEEAADVYRRAIEIRPHYTEAYRVLMMLQSVHQQDDVAAMEALDAGQLADADRMHLQFALAKVYEDRGEVDRAFQAMTRANRLRRSQFNYDVHQDVQLMEQLMTVFDAAFFAERSAWSASQARPVFIIGMPRSGTTLTESILASHPDVFGAGEINILSELVSAAVRTFPADVARLRVKTVSGIAADYMKHISLLNRTGKRLVVNKMPGNFLLVGMIYLLFPAARIIHCVRDPLDTCLSCYKNYFVGLHPYAYDLRELGQYYAAYRRLMSHWQSVLPGYVHDFSYEDLVQAPEEQIRQLLAYCGLDWDQRCLDFHRNERQVKTASSTQVRQPIYQSSAHAWEKYGDHLQPLIQSLAEQGVKV